MGEDEKSGKVRREKHSPFNCWCHYHIALGWGDGDGKWRSEWHGSVQAFALSHHRLVFVPVEQFQLKFSQVLPNNWMLLWLR